MKPLSDRGVLKAFTLLELLVVVLIGVILLVLVIPSIPTKCSPPLRTVCQSNLKQNTIALLVWAQDQRDQFPWAVSTNSGGAREWIDSGEACRQFEVLSEKWLAPGRLVCPADPSRNAGPSLQALTASNLSYFTHLTAISNTSPATEFLMGDRNVTRDGRTLEAGLVKLSARAQLDWSPDIHKRGGNIAFLDGHAEFVKTQRLTEAFSNQPGPIALYLFP